jgi:isopentenyl-diphosphate delta-isomerase
MPSVDQDLMVLLDGAGHPSGVAPRLTVHGRDTPLHLAFSCYLVNPGGQILVTRRALGPGPGCGPTRAAGIPAPGSRCPMPWRVVSARSSAPR